MLTYDQLTLADGGPWLGPIAIPTARAGGRRGKEDILAAIARKDGSENIALTGGEPLAHPDIAAIAESVMNAGYKRILVRTDGRSLADIDFLGSLLRSGISLFELMVCGDGCGIGPSSPREFRKQYPGIRNLRRIGERNELLQNIYVAAVIPVGRNNHEKMIDFLDAAFSCIEIDRVVLCWGEPGFPVWRAGENIERVIEFCGARQVWAATRGIPPCAIPGKLHHLEELFVRNAQPPLLSVPGQCAPCGFYHLCSRMPGAGVEYAWEPRPEAEISLSPFVNDIITKGAAFDATNAHLYSRS